MSGLTLILLSGLVLVFAVGALLVIIGACRLAGEADETAASIEDEMQRRGIWSHK